MIVKLETVGPRNNQTRVTYVTGETRTLGRRVATSSGYFDGEAVIFAMTGVRPVFDGDPIAPLGPVFA